MKTIATLIHNNAFDAVVLTDNHGNRIRIIDSAETFAKALKTGDDQDLANWSGDLLDEGVTAQDCGDIMAINTGDALLILNDALLKHRLRVSEIRVKNSYYGIYT